MLAHRIIGRTLPAGAWALTMLLSGTPRAAAPGEVRFVSERHAARRPADVGQAPKSKSSRAACKAAYKAAKEQEQSARLREAEDSYLSCSKTCGAVLQPKCAANAAQLDGEIPSVLFVVTDNGGALINDVTVRMDGVPVSSGLDGRPLPIDPGNHEFTLSTANGVVATQKITIMAGQHSVPISFTVGDRGQKALARATPSGSHRDSANLEPGQGAQKPSVAAEEQRRLSRNGASAAPDEAAAAPKRDSVGPGPLPFIVGGAGVAAVGAGVLLNIWGRQDNNKLLASCAPNCQQSSADHVRHLYVAADISIGVGVAALGVASFLYFTGNHAKENPAIHTGYAIDVEPTPKGVFATVSGAF